MNDGQHELELRCPRGHLCVYADRNGQGDWLVEARHDLNSKTADGVLGFQPKKRRRLRRLPATGDETVDVGGGLLAVPAFGNPRYRASAGTVVVFACPDCGDSSKTTLA